MFLSSFAVFTLSARVLNTMTVTHEWLGTLSGYNRTNTRDNSQRSKTISAFKIKIMAAKRAVLLVVWKYT